MRYSRAACHDQNESKHLLSLSTYGQGAITEVGRWVLLSKVGEAPETTEAPADPPAADALTLEPEAAAEGLEGIGSLRVTG